jgi:hypothetical protein
MRQLNRHHDINNYQPWKKPVHQPYDMKTKIQAAAQATAAIFFMYKVMPALDKAGWLILNKPLNKKFPTTGYPGSSI